LGGLLVPDTRGGEVPVWTFIVAGTKTLKVLSNTRKTQGPITVGEKKISKIDKTPEPDRNVQKQKTSRGGK